jgi:hypothetical protein
LNVIPPWVKKMSETKDSDVYITICREEKDDVVKIKRIGRKTTSCSSDTELKLSSKFDKFYLYVPENNDDVESICIINFSERIVEDKIPSQEIIQAIHNLDLPLINKKIANGESTHSSNIHYCDLSDETFDDELFISTAIIKDKSIDYFINQQKFECFGHTIFESVTKF